MPEQSLISCDFQIAYGPSDDLVRAFYDPALSHCISYDCMIGSWSSAGLAAAASGVDRLIGHRGTMSLLAGVMLDEAGVKAARKDRELEELLSHRLLLPLEVKDREIIKRLEILAWMAADETLQIRLVLPQRGGEMHPVSETGAEDFSRTGIFTDAAGRQVALQEWQKSEGRFFVFKSWDAGAPYLAVVRQHFDRLWEGREPGWMTLSLPAPVMDRLIQFRPLKPPLPDRPTTVVPDRPELASGLKEKLVFQFLRDVIEFPGESYFPSASDLERALTGSGTLATCWERHSEIENAWHLRWQGKLFAVTFDRECFECHRDTLILLAAGEPLLQGLLKGVASLKSPETCQVPLVRHAVATPGFPVAYYHLGADEEKPLMSLASLEAALGSGLPEEGPLTVAETRAREHYNTLVRRCREARERKNHAAGRIALGELEEQGKRILVKSALCDIARSRHATLFDENLIAAGFDEATLLRQGEKSPHLAKLLSLIAAGRLKPASSDPFLREIEEKSESEIRAIEDSLQREAGGLLRIMDEIKNRDEGGITSPAIDVQRFYRKVRKESPPLMLVISPPAKERFRRYLPFYSIGAAVEKFGLGRQSKEEGWMEVERGRKLKKTMWITRMRGQAMAPLIADGSFAVFDAAVPELLDGLVLLVKFGDIYDPDLGEGMAIRRFQGLPRVENRTIVRYEEIRLEPINPEYPSIVLKNVEADDLKVIGRYVAAL